MGGDAAEPAPDVLIKQRSTRFKVSGSSKERLGRHAARACAGGRSSGSIPVEGSTMSDVRRRSSVFISTYVSLKSACNRGRQAMIGDFAYDHRKCARILRQIGRASCRERV